MKRTKLNEYYDLQPMNFKRFDPNLEKYYFKEEQKEEILDKYIQIETKYKYKLHYKLKWWLDILISDLYQNDDALIIIVAPEGSGKTIFGSQIGDYMSSQLKTDYNINCVHFDGQSYIDKSLNSPQYTINHLDESRRALNKMRSISTGNVEFMNFLSECRSQNQIHIIILPAFADLEQYVAIHRVKLLISLEKKRDPATKKIIRGLFKVHITKNKQDLKEQWDRKYNEFTSNMTAFSGKFENVFCLDKDAYDKKKEKAKIERYTTKDEETGQIVLKKSKGQHIQDFKNQGLSTREILVEMEKIGMKTSKDYINKFANEKNLIHYKKV